MKILNTKFKKSTKYFIRNNRVYYSYTKKRKNRRQKEKEMKFILSISNLLFLTVIGILLLIMDYNKETIVVDESMAQESNIVSYASNNMYIPDNISYEIKTLKFDPEIVIKNKLGEDIIAINNYELLKQDLPCLYYENLDYSSFQPFMSYKMITDESSEAYGITYSSNSYTDKNGFRRYKTTNDQFTIDGKDDYVVALGTFYKDKGTAGDRYLVVTTTGMYTIITGDEKDDYDTDPLNMFTMHSDGRAGLIEWIVDTDILCSSILSYGTVTAGPVKELQGEIIGIYEIK